MAIPTKPYNFPPPGNVIASVQVNADFDTLYAAFANLDKTNVGAAGFTAANIIPTSNAEGTFGGVFSYTFPTTIFANAGINAGTGTSFVGTLQALEISTGQISCSSISVGLGGPNFPPVMNIAGAGLGSQTHIVAGSTRSFSGVSTTVTLAPAAAFTSATSYQVFASSQGTAVVTTILHNSGSSFQIGYSPTGDYMFDFFAIGT